MLPAQDRDRASILQDHLRRTVRCSRCSLPMQPRMPSTDHCARICAICAWVEARYFQGCVSRLLRARAIGLLRPLHYVEGALAFDRRGRPDGVVELDARGEPRTLALGAAFEGADARELAFMVRRAWPTAPHARVIFAGVTGATRATRLRLWRVVTRPSRRRGWRPVIVARPPRGETCAAFMARESIGIFQSHTGPDCTPPWARRWDGRRVRVMARVRGGTVYRMGTLRRWHVSECGCCDAYSIEFTPQSPRSRPVAAAFTP